MDIDHATHERRKKGGEEDDGALFSFFLAGQFLSTLSRFIF